MTGAGEDVKKLQPRALRKGLCGGAAILKRRLAAPPGVKCRCPVWPSSSAPRHVSKVRESTCSEKNVYRNFCSSIIHNSKKVKPTQTSITDEWIHKRCVYTMEYYLASESNGILRCCTCGWIMMTLCWERVQMQKALCGFHLCELSRNGKPTETESSWVSAGAGGREGRHGATSGAGFPCEAVTWLRSRMGCRTVVRLLKAPSCALWRGAFAVRGLCISMKVLSTHS